ncbi:MAG: hypothetical protein PHO75_02205 [Candidatus Shapirobacteria bacterium]|nr:hypothetical protein [Candidatus Shapirobacteria bacterium]
MYFTADFETNDYSQFTSSGGGTLAITTEQKIQGSYASKMWNNANVRKDLGAQYATLFSGAYFRWNGTPNGYGWFVMLGDGAASLQYYVYVWGGKLRLYNGSSYSESALSLGNNTWYFIEIQMYPEGGHTRFNLQVDGVTWCTLLGDLQGSDTGVRYIKWQGTNSDGVQSYLDNCVASDTQIDYGLKIPLATKSILSQNPRDYAFWSRYASVKLAQIATGNITVSGGTGSAQITHDLGFAPTVHVFAELSSGKWWSGSVDVYNGTEPDLECGLRKVGIASSGGELVETYIDTTKVNLVIKGADGTVPYVLLIFAESG